jgi:hypothetical protein
MIEKYRKELLKKTNLFHIERQKGKLQFWAFWESASISKKEKIPVLIPLSKYFNIAFFNRLTKKMLT